MPQLLSRPKRDLPKTKIKRRLWIIAGLPIFVVSLFYILRENTEVMDWIIQNITRKYAGFMGNVFSIFPFSVAEILIEIFFLFLVSFLCKTLYLLLCKRNKIKILMKRLLSLSLVLLYIWTGYCWLFAAGYYGSDFSDQIGLISDGVTTEELISVTTLFSEKVNELSMQVPRNEDGLFAADLDDLFAESPTIYDHLVEEFPSLNVVVQEPKPMFLSKLLSYMGFTGFYFPLTGESNINTDSPAFLIPDTIAHEISHQLGVTDEEEANFAGITACITSDQNSYQYSGYMSGLIYLMNALLMVDQDAQHEVRSHLTEEVLADLTYNSAYWDSYSSSSGEVAQAIYDSYLKANGQVLGIQSYGACVDLLVAYFS